MNIQKIDCLFLTMFISSDSLELSQLVDEDYINGVFPDDEEEYEDDDEDYEENEDDEEVWWHRGVDAKTWKT